MLNNGWIKLHRKITLNPIFRKGHYFKVFCYCLLQANTEDKELIVSGELYQVPRGSFVTSLKTIKLHCNVSIQQTRTILNFLKSTQMITYHTNRQFSHIGVVNYDLYQTNQHTQQLSNNKRITNEQQTNNNKVRKIRKKKKDEKYTDEATEFLEHFNETFKTKYRSTNWLPHYAKHRETYSLDEIKQAVTKARTHPFWGDKLNPEMLFRSTKDRIGMILNDKRSQTMEVITWN